MSHSPTSRAQDILRRLEEHNGQPETIKTCFGILAIMSRDDSHKTLIAVDGMERILNAMMVNIDRADVQEAGCDLLWSLAFNSAKVKEIIGKYGGTTVLVRGLKRHAKSADFLKSACGALSNLCQSKMNQHGFSSHGGIQPLVGAINIHQQNSKLLPFIFDALASLIVGNEENAKMMSTQDGITLVLSTLAKLKNNTDVVKSGCHALAILSDVKGQANKIALGGGVVIILSLLDLHPSYADFHRVAAVVLLRMLQETPAIAREITANEGVRILLKSLDKGGALEDTVAAVTHILSSITSPLNANSSMIESQLWISPADASGTEQLPSSQKAGPKRGSGLSKANDAQGSLDWHITSKSIQSLNAPQPVVASPLSALSGLVRALETYCQRRDVVRAGCRLLSHVIGFAGVVMALDSLYVMDRIFDCVSVHSETKDVLESTASLLKAIHRRTTPTFLGAKPSTLRGIIIVLRYKITDDDIVTACMELLGRYHAVQYCSSERLGTNSLRHSGDKSSSGPTVLSQHLEPWEHECLGLCYKVIETLLGTDHNAIDLTTGLIKCLSQQRKSMSSSSTKSTKMLHGVLNLVEKIASFNRGVMNAGPFENQPQLNISLSRALHTVSDTLTPKYSDIIRKIEALLPSLTNRCVDRPGSGSIHRNLVVANAGPIINTLGVKGGLGGSTGHHPLRPSSSSTMPGISNVSAGLVGTNICEKGTARAPDSGRRSSTGNFSSPTMSLVKSNTPPLTGRSGPGQPSLLSSETEETTCDMGQIQTTNSLGSLLINWPFFLEKIIINPSLSVTNRPVDDVLDRGGARMHTVYQCKSAAGLNVPSRVPITLPYSLPQGGIGTPFEHSVTFNSEFECGNIQCAIQRGEKVYDLCLRPDLHTPGHTQWFYFAVSNIHHPSVVARANLGLPVNKHVSITFNIINFTKPDSSFNSGMRPVFYSMKDAATKGIGWVRHGSDISYTANDYQRLNAAGEGVECYFSLSFTMEFHNIDDTCLIAYSYPYSHSDCNLHVESLLSIPRADNIIRRHRLCQTLGGKNCDLLIVTDFTDPSNIGPLGSSATPVANLLPTFDALQEQLKPAVATGKPPKRNKNPFRRGIVISARVHPGETPASWVMRGALDYLVSDTPGARMLRTNYVFFIVPMLNPDGVIFGNNRCSLAGVDLNRQWKIPMKQQHPTVYHLKTLMLEQKSFRDIIMYIDIHGHSRKYNVFLYGCDDKKKPTPKARDFPRIFSQHDIGKKYVSLDDCSFHVKKSREATARVVACRDLNIPMSYTIEATFCGPDSGPLKYYHMNIGHLLDCGGAMCDSILQYTFADGQFPEGSSLPEPFRGLTKIDHSSYMNPEEKFKMKGPICISVESAKALLESGSRLLRSCGETSSSNCVGVSAFEESEKQASAVNDVKAVDPANGNDSRESPLYSFDDDEIAEKESVVADELNDNGAFLSGSSDEDEEPDGMVGEEYEDSVNNDAPPALSQVASMASGEDDDYDSFIEAEDGMDNAENVDSESMRTTPNDNSEDQLRSTSAPPVDADGNRRQIQSSPIAKGTKTRTNLPSLIDDKGYNIAGPIATQRVSDGIAMLPRPDNNTAALDNM